MNAALTPGFAAPVGDAQACFRLVLDAMARPGQVHTVPGAQAPAPLCDAAGAVVLTLLDHETPLWMDQSVAAARSWIAFHTGAPVAATPGAAAFTLAVGLADLSLLNPGTDEAPETSATAIVQVTSLTGGQRFVLTGPGLRAPVILAVAGLPPNFAAIWQANHALFPRGIDLILCAGNQLAALPRSVTVREG